MLLACIYQGRPLVCFGGISVTKHITRLRNLDQSLEKNGRFCEYGDTDDVKQKKEKTENKTTPNKA